MAAEIAELNECIMPAVLHHGLDDIPDEVLARVLEVDAHCAESAVRPEELRLVNKRFEAIVTSTPECWSKVGDDTPRRRIFVDAPVDLDLDQASSFWNDVNYYHKRIRSLKVDSRRGLYVSLLEEGIIDSSSLRYLSSSFYPYLTCLTCCDIPPPCDLQLTHYELDSSEPITGGHDDNGSRIVKGYEIGRGPDYHRLTQFLASMPSLQSLSFPVDTKNYHYRRNSITLPHLKKLFIRTNFLSYGFLQALECPNLEVMDVLFDTFHDRQQRRVITSTPSFTIPNVKNLTIRHVTLGYDLEEEFFFFVEIFDIHNTFTHLRSLTIDGNFNVSLADEQLELELQRNQDGCLSLDRLESVYFHVPMLFERVNYVYDHMGECELPDSLTLHNNWDELSRIFLWYEERGARLKYLDVKEWLREGRTKSQLDVAELSLSFPEARIQVDNVVSTSGGRQIRRQYPSACLRSR